MESVKNTLLHPWTAVQVKEENGKVTVEVWGRSYIFDNAALPTSIISQGREILASPIKVTGLENEEDIVWSEQGIFVAEHTNEYALLCGYMQSTVFVINTALKIEYDGFITADLKIVQKGKTVAQIFGIDKNVIKGYDLKELKVEFPLVPEYSELYHYWPNIDGDSAGENPIANSGNIKNMMLPFKPVMWLGTDKAGLSWCCESDECWDYANGALEVATADNANTFKMHLFDGEVPNWKNGGQNPLCYRFGIQASPVKPYVEEQGERRCLHIDCFKKVETDYHTFLFGKSAENPNETNFDRISRLGVNVLFLHEKWNCFQNYYNTSTKIREDTKEIVAEAHRRGIKVLPYFGYEIASMAPEFYDMHRDVRTVYGNPLVWYRQPPQRDYRVCYGSAWRDKLTDGIIKALDEFGFDGVYLDGTVTPRPCMNERHGCGYRDNDGNLHPTYPVWSLREMMRKLYTAIDPKDGIVCVHPNGMVAPPLLTFTHLYWDGETLQYPMFKDALKGIPTDYCRAQLVGRNSGVPAEFLVYEHPHAPDWSFKKALSLLLSHGILPKPNDIGKPLETMSQIWDIFDNFGVSRAEFIPYWENKTVTDNDSFKCSYYIKNSVVGKPKILLMCCNPTPEENSAEIRLSDINLDDYNIFDAETGEKMDSSNAINVSLSQFGYKILYLE